MSLNSMRRTLFLTQRTLGDINAINRGRVGPRIWNRILGRLAHNLMKGLLK